jgi:hypothetical protein
VAIEIALRIRDVICPASPKWVRGTNVSNTQSEKSVPCIRNDSFAGDFTFCIASDHSSLRTSNLQKALGQSDFFKKKGTDTINSI